MAAMQQTEPTVNVALGAALRGMMPGCMVHTETTRAISSHAGKRPDVLVTAADRAPVVVEAEYEPAAEVELDAVQRIDQPIEGQPRRVEAAIALRYPASLRNAYHIEAALASESLSYCVLYADETRFPTSGWLNGGVADLADLIRLVSVPQREIDAAADALERGIEDAANILDAMDATHPTATANIARLLGMANVPQTRRMAAAILANALVFQERVAAIHQGISPPRHTASSRTANPQAKTLAAWSEILDINYWPIFSIGKDILEQIDPHNSRLILNRLEYTAGDVNASGVSNAHDLTGRIFQRLIADRKYLATFYTLPASAALLARLAVAKLGDIDWSDPNAIAKLRVGDFACGTGALLSAVYEQIANRHERAGGKAEDLHTAMMEEVLYGCDVMPSAIHITGATLSGIQPNIGYSNSRLYTLPYGRQSDGSVQIGSLELLQSSAMMTLFNTNDPALRTGSIGEDTAAQVTADIPDEGFDIVIMNPPFTRATNHEGAHANVVNPAFAAFDATNEAQTDMGKRVNQFGRGTSYHGNAGLASAFTALADRKLKPGGVIAFVLPLSSAVGKSWEKFRTMLATAYTDLEVLSIAANGKDMAFSSDTGMGECLVIARKRNKDAARNDGIKFTSLAHRPGGFLQASELAKVMTDMGEVRNIEDGPYGGTAINIGSEHIGEILEVPIPQAARKPLAGWGAVRLRDSALAQTAYALAQSNLWLPANLEGIALKTTSLDSVGKLGLVHRDINGPAPRGPFTKITPSPTATYPSLWNHDAKKETLIVVEPDSALQVRQGMEVKAADVWATASRSHLNLDFGFGSQPLATAFTEQMTIGGAAWPNVIFEEGRFDYAFALWDNSTLGLLLHWWHSSRQHPGRGRITIRLAESLPVLDLRALSDAQLAAAERIFDEFRTLELKPAYLADADPNRARLDRRVLCDMLGFDEGVYQGVRRLAAKWCAEPSVHGGKRRPKSAKFVM